jgi:type I restriction enzyme R subunit
VRDSGSIDVKLRWRELEMLSERERIAQFSAATKADLLGIAAPLMQWRSIRGEEEAYEFDLLMTRLEVEVRRGGPTSPRALDYKGRVQAEVELLMKNQNPVKAKAAAIGQVRSKDFWETVAVPALEELRLELRGIMRFKQEPQTTSVAPLVIDVVDGEMSAQPYTPKLEGLDLLEYRRRVEEVIRERFAQNPILQRVRDGKAVREEELEEVARLVLQADDKANVRVLAGHDPATRRSLLTVFRGLVGLDPAAVEAAFTTFVHHHPQLSSQQVSFLRVLKHHIAENGGIELERLYEPPFTTIHRDSVDGVFQRDVEVNELLAILAAFEPRKAPASAPPKAQDAS